jgi:hypothetical protein
VLVALWVHDDVLSTSKQTWCSFATLIYQTLGA